MRLLTRGTDNETIHVKQGRGCGTERPQPLGAITKARQRLALRPGRCDGRRAEEADHRAHEGDHEQDEHRDDGADLLLGHEPPAQQGEDQGQQLGEDAVERALERAAAGSAPHSSQRVRTA